MSQKQLPLPEVAPMPVAPSDSAPVVPSNASLPAGMPSISSPAPTQIRVSMADAVRIATEHFEKGRRSQAESVALEILSAEPEQPDALHICGAIAHLAGKNGLALAILEKAARLQPGNGQVFYNLGVVLQAIKREDQARAAYITTLKLMPHHVGALQNMGNIALFTENWGEAEGYYQRALGFQPNSPILTLALAMLYMAQRRLAEAGPLYDKALALAPDSPQVQWETAQFRLLNGDFKNGWQLYEARFPAGDQCKVWRYPFPFPLWRGESLAGKHLLVHGEQGLGDEIMFLSIVPQLMAEGARVSIVGQPHLHPLWRQVFPQSKLFDQIRANEDAWTKVAPPWLEQFAREDPPDYQIPFGSLALMRRTSASDFKHQKAYISVSQEAAAEWDRHLTERVGRAQPLRHRIGLVWAGNPAHNNVIANRKDARRSIGLEPLTQLADLPGIDWVSLQTWEAAQQVRDIASKMTILDCSARLQSFADTAALIANLDAVITVDTSVCHLASAMGKPVFLLLPHGGEWRWGLDPKRSLWWPTARLFRQPKPWDWASVVRDLRGELLAWQRQNPVGATSSSR